ncbi:MAG TPA: hypothetical protein VLH84_00840 [Patescibacteria group bacterium]|nr:hypothetical protein [Patescibacteria group bacterium]
MYQAREGIDYIPNFFVIAGVDPAEENEGVIRDQLDARLREYHPDRVDDLAPEFRARAAVMGPLLTRARTILRDPVRRADHRQLLEEWDGPISIDGTPWNASWKPKQL